MTKAVLRMSDDQLFEYDDLSDLSKQLNLSLDTVKLMHSDKKIRRKLGYMFVNRTNSIKSIEPNHNIYIETMTGVVFTNLINVTRRTGITMHQLKKLNDGETIEKNGFSVGRFNTDYFKPKYHRAGESNLVSCVVKAKEMLFFPDAKDVLVMDPITEHIYRGILMDDDLVIINILKGSERGFFNIKLKDNDIRSFKKLYIKEHLVSFNRYKKEVEV